MDENAENWFGKSATKPRVGPSFDNAICLLEMKDSSVSPAGLFDTRRQRKLLDGLANRFQTCRNQQRQLCEDHDRQRIVEEQEFGERRAIEIARCDQQRREMLQEWDAAEEQLTSQYETTTVRSRIELERLAAKFRQQASEERKRIALKVQQRAQAARQQYEATKNQPLLKKQKEVKGIDDSLVPLRDALDQARELTIRRLDGLPDVQAPTDSDEGVQVSKPHTVVETIESIHALTNQCQQLIDEMHSGKASKFVDSFFLPLVGFGFAVLWAAIVYFVRFEPIWLWMVGGIILIGILVFVALTILMVPIKRMTASLFPSVILIGHAADQCAAEGRKIAARTASEASAQLVRQRDSQIEAAERWQSDQLSNLAERIKKEQEEIKIKLQHALVTADEQYTTLFAEVGEQMGARADQQTSVLNDHLASTDQEINQQREARSIERYAQLQHLGSRLKEGVRQGLARISASQETAGSRFPDWQTVLNRPSDGQKNLDFVPIGTLKVRDSLIDLLQPEESQPASAAASRTGDGNGSTRSEQVPDLLPETEIPSGIPVVLHRRLHSGLVIHAPPQYLEAAIDLAHQVLWRLLTGAPPSRSKLTLIDPLGRGQHFTSFMALTDYDPSLVGHRVWTTDSKIDARLAELAHHVEDVLQASLRDRFQRIEDYNELAGSMAEPYRAVAAVGFPEGLTREGYRHLRALLESGLRCGIFTVMVCDRDKPWPIDMPIPSGEKILQVEIHEDGNWHLHSHQLEQLPFEPAGSPSTSQRKELVDKIGDAALAASRVEIPLSHILSEESQGKGSTDAEVQIAIGSQGANRSLSLRLGEGVRQHVLIAGKTGSGKSTLLHSIITSGAHHYTPDQLQFFLLDFKKGVEFKPYADIGLPHARVIGIESEREFGRSVLQRLDQELQERGEKFRAAGVQELGDYRDATGASMPRIMLVVDEFQELFVRDDRLASDCTMLLDRLVRQGRSFGMHVVLSSQSLAGAYSLPRATLGQMAVRIAMHCSESDASLILSDDNTAARLISRPGEAIYNDAGGLLEGNQPFQVAWLSTTDQRKMLSAITSRDERFLQKLGPPVIFEGNRPCRWSPALADAALDPSNLSGLLGEAVEIGPPVAVTLSRDNGRNVLLMGASETRGAVLASICAGLAKSHRDIELVYFDGARVDDARSLTPWLSEVGIKCKTVKVRDSEPEMVKLQELIKQRGDQDEEVAPLIVVIDPLERFRDLRQEESFQFSLESDGNAVSGSVAFQNVLRDGPSANVFVFVICGSVETLSRWLPRASHHDLEQRVLGQMNASDSSMLIDSPIASDLSAATMLCYDDSNGSIVKFRQCDLADPNDVKRWLSSG